MHTATLMSRTTEHMMESKTTTPAGLMLRTSFSSGGMERQSERDLQLLLHTTTPRGAAVFPGPQQPASPSEHPQLDLSLSISIGPPPLPQQQPSTDRKESVAAEAVRLAMVAASRADDAQALKQQTAEQSRLASTERAYAERVMELARREVELAEREFARARAIWERARVEVEKVERMKETTAARRLIGFGSAAALEITCHACMQRFHP